MDKVYKYIIQKTITDKIDKKDAVQLLELLKQEKEKNQQMDIAVIGMALKTSRANNVREFWRNLKSGVDCIRPIPDSRKKDLDEYLRFKGLHEEDLKYRKLAYFDEIDKFDYEYFNLSPREAELMDPNQRIFLETAYTAIEDAGFSKASLKGTKTGLYLGFITANYNYQNLLYEVDAAVGATTILANMAALIPSRVSYSLDLRGPSILVDTTCSSSLVATHLACQAIRAGECEQAIVGGIKINLLPLESGPKIGIESSTGRTLSFDEASDGTGQGEGVGVVILKPLKKALRDGDNIQAVIKGSAINQDGQSIGITAPNTKAQSEVIISAWQSAQVNPESISYIEAHGTGTSLGDPIEIEGITDAFRKYTDKKQFCAVGSVKSNIGHLDEAAGIFGLIKTVLSLQQKQIPASLNFHEPNHKIDWSESAVFVNNKLGEWKTEKKNPRRAGVASFGLSGTNCHVVLEEVPEKANKRKNSSSKKLRLFTLSAKNKKSLDDLIFQYQGYFKTDNEFDLDDFCYTANVGRNHYNFRLAILFKNKIELIEKINKLGETDYSSAVIEGVYFKNIIIVSDEEKKRERNEIYQSEIDEKTEAANQLIDDSKILNNNFETINKFCLLYVSGAQIDWEKLYQEKKYKRISLPTYQFLRNRCWFGLPKAPQKDIYHELGWREEKLDPLEMPVGEVLVLRGKGKRADEIFQELANKVGRKNIIEISQGGAYKKINLSKFTVGSKLSDYYKVLKSLKTRKLRQVIHLGSLVENKSLVVDTCSLADSQERGVYSLYYLTKTLRKYFAETVLSLVLISDYVNEVSKNEKIIKSENASLFGLGKGILIEIPNWQCRAIDIDEKTGVKKIVTEIRNGYRDHKVAFRDNIRYIEEFRKILPDKNQNSLITIRPRGVYLISGGTGGVAGVLAKFISSKEKVRLVLISRNGFPDRNEWEKLLNNGKVSSELRQKINNFLEIEKNGSEIFFYSADVANKKQLNSVLISIKKNIGRINGIVHTAGIANEEKFDEKSEKVFRNTLAAKVQGTWLLDHLTRGEELDFFSLFSSAITCFGGLHSSDYIAANSYLDAYAFAAKKEGVKITAINWPFWQNIGMHAGYTRNEEKIPLKNISFELGAEEWLKSLKNETPGRIIIGELNYGSKSVHLIRYSPFSFSAEMKTEIEGVIESSVVEQENINVKLKGNEQKDYSLVEKEIAQIWSDVLGYEEIDVRDNFFDLGGDSLFIAEIFSRIEKKFPNRVNVTQLFTYPTVEKLARFISHDKADSQTVPVALEKKLINTQDIAVIGMAVKTSLADNCQQLWKNLVTGKECIREIPIERKNDIDNYLRLVGAEEKFLKYSPLAYLTHIDQFDYEFFKFSPREAKLMDPNQRLFLETTLTAIEEAGYGGEKLRGTNTGLYLGFGPSDFEYKDIINNSKMPTSTALFTGNLNALIPSRISYLLDLRGPSLVVDTACSSSLVAIHLACQALLSGDCELAIAGGVRLNLVPLLDRFKVGIESSDWRTKTFDNSSDGTGMGEGVAAVLLKPLEKAKEDGDNIYAVIKGSAVNQDGQSVGITAPNTRAQTDVISAAWINSQINPSEISYIEAHGTGTSLGDPIEIEGITNAFRRYTDKKQFCAISAIKPNLGHTLEAAGIFSFIKAILSLKNKKLLPTINFHEPNHQVNWEDSAIFINDKVSPWLSADGRPRLCGVSSFGLSGTNCHVVLSEAPREISVNESKERVNIFTISAKTKISFEELVNNYIDYFSQNKKLPLSNVCYTANTGRGHYEERLAIVAESIEQLLEQLLLFRKHNYKSFENQNFFYNTHKLVNFRKNEIGENEITEKKVQEISVKAKEQIEKLRNGYNLEVLRKVCSLYIDGARIAWEDIYQGEKLYKVSLPTYPFLRNRCWAETEGQSSIEVGVGSLHFLHPLLEKCLARSSEQDIYSTIFSPEKHFVLGDHIIDGSHVLPGTVYVEIAKQISKIYYGETGIEIKNLMFISPVILDKGEQKEVQIIVKEQGGFKKFFVTSRITNSIIGEQDQWQRHVEGEIYPCPNLTLENYRVDEVKNRCNQKKIDVDINKIAAGFIQFGLRWQNYHLINLGDGEALAELELPHECLHDLEAYYLHPSMLDMAVAAASMALGFKALPYSYDSIKILSPMPRKIYSYFKRIGEYNEVEETVGFDIFLFDQQGKVFAEIENFKLKRTRDFKRVIQKNKGVKKNHFYKVGWQAKPLADFSHKNKPETILVFVSKSKRAKEIVSALACAGNQIIEVKLGERYRKINDNSFIIDNKLEDYINLIKDLEIKKITKILHLFSLTEKLQINNPKDLEESQKIRVFSLFYLAKSLAINVVKQKIDIVLISEYVDKVNGNEVEIRPENSPLFGFGKIIGMEESNWQCRAIDIDFGTDVKKIIEEINKPYKVYKVAYRDNLRFEEEVTHFDIETLEDNPIKIKTNGTYLITGGAGGVGLAVATRIAETKKVNLVLLNRTKLPDREKWEEILASNNVVDAKPKKIIKQVLEIEKTKSNILIVPSDISDYDDTVRTLSEIRKKFGKINGIIHAAGVAGDGFIFAKDELTVRNVLAPKIQGTWILDNLTKDEDLDFFILFSSTTSLHGAPGQSDYTAANSYLDSYGPYRITQGRKTLVINWAGWKEVGMLSDNRSVINFGTLSTEEALDSFSKVLNKKISNIVVGDLSYVGSVLFEQKRLPLELSVEIKSEIFQTNLLTQRAGLIKSSQEIKIKGGISGEYKEMEKIIAHIWSEVLGISEIDVSDHFFDLGGDSLRIAEVHSLLEKKYPGKFSVAELFAYPTISKLVDHIESQSGIIEPSISLTSPVQQMQDIAVIGLAARTSNATDINEFWKNIVSGIDCIRDIPEERKADIDNYLRFKNFPKQQRKYYQAAYLEDIDRFDYEFFKISPREAELMDPNQRILLETVYHAIESAGYGGKRLSNSKTGFYVGLFPLGVKYYDMIAELEPAALSEAMVNNMEPTIASRISYYLNLTGPSMLVNTACSSSLVAIHLACQAIRNGDCDQALVGSIKISLLNLENNPKVGIESSNRHTHTFDNDSDGTGLGEGAAALMLKPLSQAILDGDNVMAVIKGSAINQDGQSVGITAPNALAQTEVISTAWKNAKINPETISYVEAHGTGTNLGDPIEIEALASAFRKYTNKKQFCAIGSVKSNLGHLLEAAGIFSFIKTILALNYKIIPPTINFREPNQKVSWEDSPVYIKDCASDWQSENNQLRRAGVSSFGLSGTNCHLVVEEAPLKSSIKEDRISQNLHLFVLSARSLLILRELSLRYINYFNVNQGLKLSDVCYTAGTGREHHNCRLVFVVKDMLDLQNQLEEFLALNISKGISNLLKYGDFKIVPLGQKNYPNSEITEKEALGLGREIEVLSHQFQLSGRSDEKLLEKICELYVSGASFDWLKFYNDSKYAKINLPLYPFARNRSWLKVRGEENYPEFYHNVAWKRGDLLKNKTQAGGVVLVFFNDGERGKKIIQALSKTGREIIKIRISESYKKINKNYYTIRNEKEEYKLILSELRDRGITQIVHLLTLDSKKEIKTLEELNGSQRMGVYSLLFLTQAMQTNFSLQTFDFFLVSEQVDLVSAQDENIKPENSTFMALGKSVFLENPNYRCRAIDIDEITKEEMIAKEINNSCIGYKVAYRNNERYVEELVNADISDCQDKYSQDNNSELINIRENGVYLITGGGGGIGLEIAKQLAKKQKVKLALLGRNKIPEREKWDKILDSEGPKNPRLLEKIKSLQMLDALGAEVCFVEADISNFEDMARALGLVKNKFGKINGIVHAAGVAGDGFISNKGEIALKNVLAPKVQGTWILDHLTRDETLDFFVLFSSAITLVSGISVGDYTAANAYLDAYAYYDQFHKRRITSVNWSTWENIGLSFQEKINEKKQLLKVLPVDIAVEIFFKLIQKKLTRIIVGEINYESDVLFLGDYLPLNFSSQIKDKTRKVVELVEKQVKEVILKGASDNAYTETENALALIWSEVLGYKEIDIRDNFFELGGDSLAGIRLISKINQKLGCSLSFREILQCPSLKSLASYISQTEKAEYVPVIKKVKPKEYKIK